MVERDDGTIRFTHPLLAAALYNNLGARRRRVHARIAEVVDDPIARARHLALAAEAPDSGVARLLDGAAALEAERGGSALAAELAEHAFLLTPPDERDERLRRALAAGRAELAAGEWTRARTIATDLLAEVEEGPIRAEALVLLSEFEHDDLAVPVLEEALRHAGSDVRLEARVRETVGRVRQAAAALEHWRSVHVVNAGVGFPKEVAMMGREIDAKPLVAFEL